MNRIFDYNGTIVAPSNPVKKLKTVKKMLTIDSGDRDLLKPPTNNKNNEITIYLPRVYENVVSLRLACAEFPSAPKVTSSGSSLSGVLYFLIDIEGLNKADECSVGADRSGYPDGYFAKIPVESLSSNIFYNDHNNTENIAHYSPAIGKLDRMHIRMRTHQQKASANSIYWDSEYSLTFEIEMLDNAFDDFSTFESRLSERA